MKLVPWHRRSDLTHFRDEFDELVERFFERGNEPETRAVVPPVNVAETEKAWTITVEVPGMTEKDVELQVLGRQLVVSGERKWQDESKGKEFVRVESRYGAFQRTIELPENARIDPSAIVATCRKGLLEIVVPKLEPTPATKIAVKS